MADVDAGTRQRVREMFRGYKASAFADTVDVTVPQLQALLNDPAKRVVVVDVREAAETAVSMIPGAVTKAQFEAEEERYAQHTVVAYCTIGYRSGKYCQQLGKQHRPEPVLNLAGSILEWTLAGLPLVTAAGGEEQAKPTKRVHVYGKQWALVGTGYEAVWHRKPLLLQVLLDTVLKLFTRLRSYFFK